MTAKDHLGQLKALDIKIKQKQRQREELKTVVYSVSSVNTDNIKVSSSVKDNYNKVDKYMDLGAEIEKAIEEYIYLEHRIIGEIQQLKDPLYLEVLYKRYVEFKGLKQIADEIHYNYNYTRKIHGKALKNFNNVIGGVEDDRNRKNSKKNRSVAG